ncbi:hypothetical protein [Streptomyces sp. enrichment culture]|uniref:hypothetical protein n=1 Tax=Streptomyces sp. enrichment culture TaxID=1795815 RepID=UPI003F546CAE
MTPTPKVARTYRRKPNSGDRTKNTKAYRVEASWNARPDRPAATTTPDRRRADRLARQWAASGAYVIVQTHTGWDTWRTLYELDGPAHEAERRAAERAALDQARRAAQEAEARIAAAEQRDRDEAALTRLMTRPPVARDQCGRRDARHITGAQR